MTGEKLKNLVSAFILKATLEWVCVSYLCETYDPFAFKLETNPSKIFASYVMLAIICMCMPTDRKNISSLICWLFVAIAYIPSLIVYGFGNESQTWIMYVTLTWLVIYAVLFYYRNFLDLGVNRQAAVFRNKQKKYLDPTVISDTKFWWTVLFILGYTFLAIATLPNIKLAFDFTEIYDVRSGFTPILPFAVYLVTWSIYVVNPILIVYFGVIHKNRNLTILTCLSQLFLYAGNGQKTTLFSIPLVLILIFFWSKERVGFYGICNIISIILVANAVSFLYLDDKMSSAIVASRVLIVPAISDFYYFDFFSKLPPVMLAHGILGLIFPNSLEMMPWFIIGKNYFGNADLSANTGMLGDAYMNFKEVGLLINALLFARLLVHIDRIGKEKDTSLVLACTLMPFIWCTNGSFFSSFTSGGMGIGLLILSRIPKLKLESDNPQTISVEINDNYEKN